MPLASKRGAPRPRQSPPKQSARRCLGVLTKERVEALLAAGEITQADAAAFRDIIAEIERRAAVETKIEEKKP